MKYLSVCSGIEAASKAWESIGWKPVAFSEIEPFPSAVLKHHWPEVPNLGDMSKYEQWNIQSGSVDLLVGGTPCQSFSVAGLRQGLKDPRGNLMLTYLAIAERLKPRWLVWENVPGVLSSNGGKDFGCFLGALGELGYVDWAYRVLDAQWFGVAQRRRRVFVVAHLGEGSLAAKVLFESESVRRDTPPSRETRQGVAANVAPSLTASNDPSRSPQSSEVTQQVNAVLEASVVSPTITQCKGSRGGCSDEALMEIRAVHEALAETLMASDYKGPGHNRDHNFITEPVIIDRAAFNQGQNAQYKPRIEHGETMDSLVARGPHAVAIPIHDQATRNAGKRGNKQDGKGNGLGVGKPGDPCPTLTKGDKHAVLYENHPNDSRVTGPHDVAPSCVSRYGTGGGNVPLVQEAIAFPATMSGTQCAKTKNLSPAICSVNQTAIAFEPGIATREGSESRFVKELSPTLRKEMGDNQVAVAVDCYNKTIGEKSQSISSSASDINHTGGVINPADRMAVRRLTPRECERLQGFNDDHTMIPWRNKPADQCPDGPRYKALGNSMAVPCMAWIGKRIDAVEKTK
jgi:DNA (cytosine-5)-methyltransferase 1